MENNYINKIKRDYKVRWTQKCNKNLLWIYALWIKQWPTVSNVNTWIFNIIFLIRLRLDSVFLGHPPFPTLMLGMLHGLKYYLPHTPNMFSSFLYSEVQHKKAGSSVKITSYWLGLKTQLLNIRMESIRVLSVPTEPGINTYMGVPPGRQWTPPPQDLGWLSMKI